MKNSPPDSMSDFFRQLDETSWSKRADAFEKLKKLSSISDLDEIAQILKEGKEAFLGLRFLRLCGFWFQNLNPILAAKTISIINYLYKDFEEDVRQKSYDVLDQFVSNRSLPFNFRIRSLDLSFRYPRETDKSLLMAKIIHKYKIPGLVSKIFSNLRSEDKELVKLTLEIMIELGDTRSIRMAVELLENSEDQDIIRKCVRLIGNWGYLTHSKYIEGFVCSKDIELAIDAVWATYRLKGRWALNRLSDFFTNNEIDIEVKKEIILAIGKIGKRKAFKKLLEIYLNEKNIELKNRSLWAIMDFDRETALKQIFSIFHSADNQRREKLLIIVGKIIDDRCFKLLRKIITSGTDRIYSDAEVLLAIEFVSSYSHEDVSEILIPFVKGKNILLRQYALQAMALNRHEKTILYLKRMWSEFERLNNFEQVILAKNLDKMKTLSSEFLTEKNNLLLNSDRLDFQILGLENMPYMFDLSSLEIILSFLETPNSENYSDCLTTLKIILTEKPSWACHLKGVLTNKDVQKLFLALPLTEPLFLELVQIVPNDLWPQFREKFSQSKAEWSTWAIRCLVDKEKSHLVKNFAQFLESIGVAAEAKLFKTIKANLEELDLDPQIATKLIQYLVKFGDEFIQNWAIEYYVHKIGLNRPLGKKVFEKQQERLA